MDIYYHLLSKATCRWKFASRKKYFEIWPEFTCLRVSEYHFGNLKTEEIIDENYEGY